MNRLILILLLCGCKSHAIEPASVPKSTFDLKKHLDYMGWDVWLVTNGLIYEKDGGWLGVDIIDINTGRLVGWVDRHKFYETHPNLNWVKIIEQGKPKNPANPDFEDTTQHQQ